MYMAMVIGGVIAIVFSGPAILWVMKLIWPPSADEEKIHRGVEEARRRLDRFRRY
jgi:hypothetical protein